MTPSAWPVVTGSARWRAGRRPARAGRRRRGGRSAARARAARTPAGAWPPRRRAARAGRARRRRPGACGSARSCGRARRRARAASCRPRSARWRAAGRGRSTDPGSSSRAGQSKPSGVPQCRHRVSKETSRPQLPQTKARTTRRPPRRSGAQAADDDARPCRARSRRRGRPAAAGAAVDGGRRGPRRCRTTGTARWWCSSVRVSYSATPRDVLIRRTRPRSARRSRVAYTVGGRQARVVERRDRGAPARRS